MSFIFSLASENYYGITLHSRGASGLFSFFSTVLNNKIKITLTGSKGIVETDDVRWEPIDDDDQDVKKDFWVVERGEGEGEGWTKTKWPCLGPV